MILTNDEIEVLKRVGDAGQLHECLAGNLNGLKGLLNLRFVNSFLINQDPYLSLTDSGKQIYTRLQKS